MGTFAEAFEKAIGTTVIPDQASIDAMVLCAASDGEFHEQELACVLELARQLPSFSEIPQDQLQERIVSASERLLAIDDPDKALEDVASRLRTASEEQLAMAFACVLGVQYADQHVADEEDDFVEKFRAAIGMSADDARELIEEFERVYGSD